MGRFLEIAKTVLYQEGKALRIKEIVAIAKEKGYLDFSAGLTPHQTIKARISEDIKRKKDRSLFKRIHKGLFALRDYGQDEYDAIPFEKRISQNEKVLVFKTSLLTKIGTFYGVKKTGFDKYVKEILNKNNTFYIPRVIAEKESHHKQLLSYILVEQNKRILKFVRGAYTNAHIMLRGSLCIGFGGHVQDYDYNLFETIKNDNGYFNSVKRELLEELNIPEECINEQSLKIIGVLNDDSSEVGKSHFAIIHRLNLNQLKVEDVKKLKGEKSINQLEFIPIHELGNEFEKYEYWSKLCIKEYFKPFVKIDCKIHRVKNYSLNRHRKVIAIVGSIGSGKTEACKTLEQYFGYKMISSGRILQELMHSPDLKKIGRKIFQDLAYDYIIKEDGPKTLAQKILSVIHSEPKTNYVVDGIRNIKTFDILKQELGSHLTLIFVESTPDNSFKFYQKREGEENINVFFEYINHPVEQDIKFILENANVVIYNHGTLNSFQTQIKKYFKLELQKHE